MAKKPTSSKAVGRSEKETPETAAPKPAISYNVHSLPVDRIVIPPNRLRKVSDDHALGIADSMTINGQQTPIEVSDPDENGIYTLVVGAHRLRAAQINRWEEIDGVILKGHSITECLLREIDENLMRRELSPLDRAVSLAERKRVYEELYPETKAGTAGAEARWHANEKFAFASEAAEKIGVSRRSIEMAIFRFNKIVPDVREKIALTPIANKGTELDALAKLEPEEQRKAVDLVLSGEEDAPKTIAAAKNIIRGVRTEAEASPNDRLLTKLSSLFDNASARVQADFLNYLEQRGRVLLPAARQQVEAA